MPRVVTPDLDHLPEPLDMEPTNDVWEPISTGMEIVQDWENTSPPPPLPLTRSVAFVAPWDNDMPIEAPPLVRSNAGDGTEVSWSSDEEEDYDTVSMTSSEDSFESRCLALETEGAELMRQMNMLYESLGFNNQ